MGWYSTIAAKAGFNAFVVDYRLTPDVKFPDNVEDCVTGYRYLLNDLKKPADKIVVYGDSAGLCGVAQRCGAVVLWCCDACCGAVLL